MLCQFLRSSSKLYIVRARLGSDPPQAPASWFLPDRSSAPHLHEAR